VTAAARSGEADTVRTVLSQQRTYLMRELRNLDGLRRKATDPVVALLLSAATRHVEADLSFVDDADRALLRTPGALPAAPPAPAPVVQGDLTASA
jgi:hypothetical protein